MPSGPFACSAVQDVVAEHRKPHGMGGRISFMLYKEMRNEHVGARVLLRSIGGIRATDAHRPKCSPSSEGFFARRGADTVNALGIRCPLSRRRCPLQAAAASTDIVRLSELVGFIEKESRPPTGIS